LILGADEVANQSVTLKPLRTDEPQRPVELAALADELKQRH
jgi:histidyl-tRNA synthetase